VLCSAFCSIQSRICCSRPVSRAGCFPHSPGRFNPCASADCTEIRGQSNALTSALIEIGMLGSLSAISRTRIICWHRNWNRWKFVSLRKIWHKARGRQNWARRDKRISSGMAGAAGVPCDITVRQIRGSNWLPMSLPSDMSSIESEAEYQIWLDQQT
jgi:hypothetical protein